MYTEQLPSNDADGLEDATTRYGLWVPPKTQSNQTSSADSVTQKYDWKQEGTHRPHTQTSNTPAAMSNPSKSMVEIFSAMPNYPLYC
jgi:hypothetical protein